MMKRRRQMLIGIVFLIVLMVFLLVTKLKNKYTVSCVLAFSSVILLLMTLMLYISKMTVYRSFFQLEFVIYQLIGNIHIGFYDIKWLLNAGCVLFLASCLMVAVTDIYPRSRKIAVWLTVAFAFFSAVFLFANSNYVREGIYIAISRGVSGSDSLRNAAQWYGAAYMLVFSAVPYVLMYMLYHDTVLLYRKKHIRALMVSTALLQLVFYVLLLMTPLRFFAANLDVYDYMGITLIYNEKLYIYLPSLIIALLLIVTYISIKFHLLEQWRFLKKRKANKNFKILLKDMRHLFHCYKNVMVSLEFMQKKAIDNYGTDIGREAVVSIGDSVKIFSEQASNFFEIYNDKIGLNLEPVCIDRCIDFALSKVDLSFARVTKLFEDDMIDVYGDFNCLQEMFFNLVSNAAEALEQHGADDKNLCVRVWTENPWVCVSIKDNGGGIDKKIIGSIFKPFCSTKRSFTNWGLGLAYVKTVAEAHLGYVDVESKGNSTEFQVLLPID